MNRSLLRMTSLCLAIVVAGCGPLDLLSARKFQDGVSQTTPFDGVTQTTPFDGVTQTTPLVTGEVRLASGEPASNVSVTAYVSQYHVAAVGNTAKQVEVRTDASGRFQLVDPPLGINTIEAEAAEDSKAIRMNVPVSVGARMNLDPMTLQPTGAITGRVTAEGGSSLLGTTVFIPGTHYVALTAENGGYTLRNVPVGTYEVAAMRPSFATTLVSGVTITPQQTVTAPDIDLKLDAPVLQSLSQMNAGPGTELVLRGQNFGASKNTMVMVKFGSTQATRFERMSDTELRVWVPQGALSGPLVVISNGVASNALDFQVIAALKVKPYYASMYVGDRQKFEVEALDSFGTLIPTPFFDWELGSDFLGTLGEQGELITRDAGWSEVRAVSGSLTGIGAVGVSPFEVRPPFPVHEAAAGAPGNVFVHSEGVYYTHPAGDRIYFEPTDGARVVVAGTGERGFSQDGTPALEAKLNLPDGLAVDALGNLYFSEQGNHVVRVIPRADTTYRGRSLKAGSIYTVAGDGSQGYEADGGDATQTPLNMPTNVILGAGDGLLRGGSLLIADFLNRRVREVKSDGTISNVLGGGGMPAPLEGISAFAFGGTVGPGLARDVAGNLAFCSGHQLLFYCRVPGRYFGRVMEAGNVYPVAGQAANGFNGDGFGTSVRLWAPRGPAFDLRGNLYFCDGASSVRALTQEGHVRWLAGLRLPTGYSLAPTVTEVAPATSVRLSPACIAVRTDGSFLVGDNSRLYFHPLRLRTPWPVYSQ